jgi:ATP-dependent protease HslVU (ClpYQ) peptidase subunit
MNTVTLKEKLHQYVDDSDDKLLKIMYAIAKEYNEDENFDEVDIDMLEARRNNRLHGKSKVYSWADAKQMITAKA